MLVEMKVASLTVDPFTNLPTLRMADGSGRSLSIGIGQNEAPAIAAELAEVRLDRPMTHDLMKTILGLCAIEIQKVEIHELPGQKRRGVLSARLHLRQPDGVTRSVDSRPSDAVALALRARAPIFVDDKLCNFGTAPSLREPAPPPLQVMTPASKWKM
jgi:bifunctional DNase/RNase